MIRAVGMAEWACRSAWRIRLEKNETLPNRMIREGFYVFSTGSGVRALAVIGGLLTTILALTSAHAHDWTPLLAINKPSGLSHTSETFAKFGVRCVAGTYSDGDYISRASR